MYICVKHINQQVQQNKNKNIEIGKCRESQNGWLGVFYTENVLSIGTFKKFENSRSYFEAELPQLAKQEFKISFVGVGGILEIRTYFYFDPKI